MTSLLEQAKEQGGTGDERFANSLLEQQGTKGDFGRVSKIWLAGTKSFGQVMDVLENSAEDTEDISVESCSNLDFLPSGQIKLEGRRFNILPNAMRSLGQKSKVPSDFLEKLAYGDSRDQALWSHCIENGLRGSELSKKGFTLRTRGDDVRAIVSPGYLKIDNLWYMKTLKDMIPGGRVSHFKHDGDTMSFSILVPDSIRRESDSEYGGGIQGKNSEIATGSLDSMPYLFRAICMNGCIWGKMEGQEIRQIHWGKVDLSQLYETIGLNIARQIPMASEALDFLLSLKDMTCDSEHTVPTIIDLSRTHRLSQKDTLGWIAGYSQERIDSAFGVIQGLTRYSQTQPSDSQNSLELLAGQLSSYSERTWEQTFERAEMLNESVYDKTIEAYNKKLTKAN